MKKICPQCGVEFMTTFPNQKYCSQECAYIVFKEKSRNYSREYRKTHNCKPIKKEPSYEWLERINKGIRSGKYHSVPGTNLKENRLDRNGGRWK